MANIAPANMYRHRTFCYMGNQEAINTRYLAILTITGSPPTEQSFITKLDTILSDLYLPCLTTQATYVGSDIVRIGVDAAPPIPVAATVNSAPGTSGPIPLGSQTCGIYTTLTANAGRGFRGRCYMPFPSSADTITGAPPVPTSDYLANIATVAAAVIGVQSASVGGATVTWGWGIWHQSPPAIKNTFSALLSYKTRAAWATQKRRGSYGRTNPYPSP